jgi:kynurenine formamidase
MKLLDFSHFNFIDLTHTLTSGIPQWGVDCGFQCCVHLDYADGNMDTTFCVQKLEMYAGIGTHMDAPAHCIPGASTIDVINFDQLIVPCAMIDVSTKADEKYSVTCDDIEAFEAQYGKIVQGTFVIIYTSWDKYWEQPSYRNNLVFPSVSQQAADLLVARDIVGLGIDTLSPDRPNSGFPVHQIVLGAGKYIIENIANASQLPAKGAYIAALPIKIKGGTEAPVRLIGIVRSAI